MTNQKSFETLAADKAFVEKLAKLNSVEEITKAVNEAGVNVTVEEMEQARAWVESQREELNENDLDAVSGGGIGGVILGGALIWSAISGILGIIDGMNSCNKK